jgi:hypothetical protein
MNLAGTRVGRKQISATTTGSGSSAIGKRVSSVVLKWPFEIYELEVIAIKTHEGSWKKQWR